MGADFEDLTVTSYSGSRADERPLEVRRGSRSLRVREILGRWREPEAELFDVRLEDASRLLLRRDLSSGRWSLEGTPGR